MFQTVTAVSPMPIAGPTWLATGPVTTTMTALATIMMTSSSVTPSRIDAVFQIGRPSSTS